MYRIISFFAFLVLPTYTWAEDFVRPVPQEQTATAEIWFFVASVALVVALIVVNWLVSRRR